MIDTTGQSQTILPDWRDGRIRELEQQLAEALLAKSASITEQDIQRFRVGDILFNDEQAKMFCDLAQKGLRAEIVHKHEDALRATEAGDWLPLLETFSESEVLLHGAAGEDAMNVGDVVKIVRALALAQVELRAARELYAMASIAPSAMPSAECLAKDFGSSKWPCQCGAYHPSECSRDDKSGEQREPCQHATCEDVNKLIADNERLERELEVARENGYAAGRASTLTVPMSSTAATPHGLPPHTATERCGYDRNGSLSAGTYVCACGWEAAPVVSVAPSAIGATEPWPIKLPVTYSEAHHCIIGADGINVFALHLRMSVVDGHAIERIINRSQSDISREGKS